MSFPSLGRVLRDPVRHWPENLMEKDVVDGKAGARRIALMTSPALFAEVLSNRDDRFPRARLQNRILGLSYGENLIRGDTEDWRRQRREVARPMTASRAAELSPRLKLACGDMLDEWAALPAGTPVPLVRDARRLALDALWRALFCDDAEATRNDPAVDAVARKIAALGTCDLQAELEELHPLTEHALDRRVGARAAAQDTPLDFNTLRLFLHAGHDNVAAGLAWALWLLAHRPDLQARIASEWRRAEDGPFDPADHPAAAAVVREALRLYPPVLQLIRDMTTDVEADGRTVPAGATAVLCIYALQRHRKRWEAPDAFWPERFLRPDPNDTPPGVMMPFGHGPRGCIGAALAMVELTMFVAMTAVRFHLEPNPEEALRPQAVWVLRPVGAGPLTLRLRP